MKNSSFLTVSLVLVSFGLAPRQDSTDPASSGPTATQSAATPNQAFRLDELPASRPSPDVLLEAGKQLERQGAPDRARRIYLSVLRNHPELAAPHHRLALLAMRQGNPEVAEKHFDQAIALDPSNANIRSDRGYLAYLQGKCGEAEKMLRSAEALAPGDSRIQNNLGLVLGRLGQIEESFRAFRQGGTEAEAHANIAFVHALRGELGLAEEHYKQAIRLDPNLKSAADALNELAEKRPLAAEPASVTDESKSTNNPDPLSGPALGSPTPPRSTDSPVATPWTASPGPHIGTDSPVSVKKSEPQSVTTVTRGPMKIMSFDRKEEVAATSTPTADPLPAPDHEVAASRPVEEVGDSTEFDSQPRVFPEIPDVMRHAEESSDAPRIVDQWSDQAVDEAPGIVRAFIEGLRDTDSSVRRYSAMTLACYGPRAHAAVPALMAVLDDDEEEVQAAAAIALAEIGSGAESAVPALLEKLKHQNTDVVRAASWSLEKLGNHGRRAWESQALPNKATGTLQASSQPWLSPASSQPTHDYTKLIAAVILLQLVILALVVLKMSRNPHLRHPGTNLSTKHTDPHH